MMIPEGDIDREAGGDMRNTNESREEERVLGPQKPATEMSVTASKNRNSIIDDVPSGDMFPGLHIQPSELDINSQCDIMDGRPLLAFPGEHIENQIARNYFVNNSTANTEFRADFMGTSISTSSLVSLLSTRPALPKNTLTIPSSGPSASPLEDLRTFATNNSSNTLNSNIEFLSPKKDVGVHCQFNYTCDYNDLSGHQELPGKTSISTVDPLYHVSTSHSYGYCIPSNELSLSLATCQPSIVVPDQCSEISCSAVTQISSKEYKYVDPGDYQLGSCVMWPIFHNVGLGSEQTSTNRKDLLMACGAFQLPSILCGSKYLYAVQEILVKVTSYALMNLNRVDKNRLEMGSSVVGFDHSLFSSGEIKSQDQLKLAMQKQGIESKKAELLAMIRGIDGRYNQCVDQIQSVISAFHVATQCDIQIHACFALQTITALYKNLKERISSQIMFASEFLDRQSMREKEKSFDSSVVPKQWALQHLKKSNTQSWRPQRGLPEKSVCVLRQWMFQNFLHPYPKDAEKHLLAMQSGLTRNQVSNWFINARVRLWKPMIEEMYSEINIKGPSREGVTTNHRSHGRKEDERIQMN